MKYLYTGKEAAKIDKHAIYEMGMPGIVLMERAAMSAAALLMKQESLEFRFLAVSGAGNNGGDAVAVARILHENGYKVAITTVANEDKMSDDLKVQLVLASNCGVPMLPISCIEDDMFDVMIDGIFGIGLSREVTGVYRYVIEKINESRAKCYAIDIPSGISADVGECLGVAVKADYTVTFGVNKQGLVLYPGCEYAGEVFVMDIGFPRKSVLQAEPVSYIYEKEDLFRMPARMTRSHKGSYGHVLVVAGSESMSGACFLAAKAAYCSGAGLVRVVSSPCNRDVLLSALPEILFSKREELANAILWADVIVAGPGLGRDEEAKDIVKNIVEKADVPVILDGDALFLLPQITDTLSGQFILTPHVKEMTYLTGKSSPELLADMAGATKEAACKWNCVIAHKDARTIVSDGNKVYINISGNDGMATGGSGDVLAGLMGGLTAQGMSLRDAAELSVYLHGLAGDYMALEKSKYSLMASDILTGIGKVLAKIASKSGNNEEDYDDRE